ncbi:hypothetical protein LA020_002895 [Vibrio alginolyticus]|nr:hypothetical protein [Vibrio alginolyticus]
MQRPAKRKHQISRLAEAFSAPVIDHELGSYIKLSTPTGVYYIINNDLRERDTVLIATDKYGDFIKTSIDSLAQRFIDFIRQNGLIPRDNVKGRKPAMKSAKELFNDFEA